MRFKSLKCLKFHVFVFSNKNCFKIPLTGKAVLLIKGEILSKYEFMLIYNIVLFFERDHIELNIFTPDHLDLIFHISLGALFALQVAPKIG